MGPYFWKRLRKKPRLSFSNCRLCPMIGRPMLPGGSGSFEGSAGIPWRSAFSGMLTSFRARYEPGLAFGAVERARLLGECAQRGHTALRGAFLRHGAATLGAKILHADLISEEHAHRMTSRAQVVEEFRQRVVTDPEDEHRDDSSTILPTPGFASPIS